MKKVKELFKSNKILTISVLSILFFAFVIGIPTLAKLKNRTTLYNASNWDGTVASGYKSGEGTEDEPYIISDGSELAYFFEQLNETDYENKYFELSNDIIINPGIFEYGEDNTLKYILNDVPYFVNQFTNQYYDNENFEGEPVGTLNQIQTEKTFKGNLNGKSFTIYGNYIFCEENSGVALFENLDGKVNDLYFSNTMVYGKGNVAGLAINTNNSIISNISFDGYVINKSENKTKVENIEPFVATATISGTETKIELPLVQLDGIVKSVKLSGNYEVNNLVDEIQSEINLSINGNIIENNNFNIDLGDISLNEVYLFASSNLANQTINFSNLKYTIEYYDDLTSGLFINSKNASLNNVINKANIRGFYLTSGFIANVKESLQISRSYNNGLIQSSSFSGGIIGQIKNNSNHVTLTKVYNTGDIATNQSGGLISFVQDNTGLININNSINISNNYAINTVINSTVNAQNCYSLNDLSVYSGLITGEFELTNIESLSSKEDVLNISYNEFISLEDSKTNIENVWIYKNNIMPILYIDSMNNPIATLNVNKYSWNNLGIELNSLSLEKNLTFTINEADQTNPIKEKYYFVTTNLTPYTKADLDLVVDWKKYEEPVKIEESGYYVIYAKVLDMNNKTTYINTDIIALNTTGFKVNISLEEMNWDTLNLDLDEIYLNKDININIFAMDALFGINTVEYYISTQKLTEQQVKNISEWNLYTENIIINTPGKYVIYAKIVNGEGKEKYISSDYLLYNGYTQILNLGNKNIEYFTNYITNNSSINLSFESNFELDFKENYSHNLIFNMLLPEGTNLTLFDKKSNKIYEYKIETNEDLYGYNTSCKGFSNCSKYATYKFSDFKEIGTLSKLNYNEGLNYNKTIKNEKFIINVDFSNTNLVENYYDVFAYLAIKDNNDKFLYRTFENSISKFNIYSLLDGSDIKVEHSLLSDYADQPIYYNSDSETIINFTNVLEYQLTNEKRIIDTTYENKKVGIVIGLYNKNNELLNKKYLDNMLFEVNGKEYFANSDNQIKIKLGSSTDINKTLKIKTKENSSGLNNGEYYLKINEYISNDGYNYENLYNEEIIVPIIVEKQQEVIQNYNFVVDIDNESILINKKQQEHLTKFNILYFGDLVDPNIRVSLYKKKEFTAYNQDYELIDLSKYTNDYLVVAGSNQYYLNILNGDFNLNILPEKFSNNGYKFVFELYDGTKKISEIGKYFIVN